MAKVIARRKGNKYRTFDTDTARMGPWETVPEPNSAWLRGYMGADAKRTMPVLRDTAKWMGLSIPAKMRKAELIEILAVRAWFRGYSVGRELA